MDPKTTAVVLIEFQNDFTSDGGTLHAAVKPVMDSTHMLDNAVEPAQSERENAGSPSCTCRSPSPDDYRELTPTPDGILKGVVDGKSSQRNAGAPRSSTP